MCSELTPRARIPDTRIPQFMQPCLWVTHWQAKQMIRPVSDDPVLLPWPWLGSECGDGVYGCASDKDCQQGWKSSTTTPSFLRPSLSSHLDYSLGLMCNMVTKKCQDVDECTDPRYHFPHHVTILYIYHYMSLYITIYCHITIQLSTNLSRSLEKGEIKATNVGMWKWIYWCPLRRINWDIPFFSEFKHFRPGRNKIEQCGIYTSCKNSIGMIGWYSVNELEKLSKSFSVAKFMRTFSLN